jgi:D-alanyl-D-alanine carboxypeptidase (penicillin-binding protein 5/6)
MNYRWPAPKPPKRRKKGVLLVLLLLVAGLAGYVYWALTRPLPPLKPVEASHSIWLDTSEGNLSWPPSSQSAVGLMGNGTVLVHGPQQPVPTASTAKIITALMVLKQKPLQPGQTGPTLVLGAEDVSRYQAYVAKNGSVLPVQAGERLTEYQLLQALLLPSANNIADSLATWTYGSLPNYARAANGYLAEQGLKNTKVGSDASGLSPDTVSTAADLARLGKLAMQQPVIAEIVGQSNATGFPLVNQIRNVNNLLGSEGIIGVKTGNSDEAGGAFVGAATATVNGQPEIIITAVLGAVDRPTALNQSQALIKSARVNFKPVNAVKRNQVVGNYKVPWGGSVAAVAAEDLNLSAWQGSTLKSDVKLKPSDDTPTANETVGQVATKISDKANPKTVSVKLQSTPAKPSILWRLTHPL